MAEENCLSITSSLETPTMGSGSFEDGRDALFSTLSPLSVADSLDPKGTHTSVSSKLVAIVKQKPQLNIMKECISKTVCIGGGGISAAHCNDETISPSFLILDGIESIALGAVEAKAFEGRYGELVIKEAVDRWAARVDTKICVGNISYEYRQEEERSIAAGISKESNIDENSLSPTSPIGSIVSQSLQMKPFNRVFDGDDSRIINTERYMRPSHSMVADHLKHREFSEALDILEKIADHDREKYGRYDLILAMNAHNIGVVKLLAGLRDEALIAFHEAVLAKKDCLGERNPLVVDSLVEVGILFYARGEFVRALQIFNEALDILGFAVEDNGISRILNNIGCVHFAMGDTDSAKQNLMKALAIHRMSLGSAPKAESSLMNLALTQANLGHVKLSQNNGDALTSLEEALLVLQSVLGDENETETIRNTMDNIVLAKELQGSDAR